MDRQGDIRKLGSANPTVNGHAEVMPPVQQQALRAVGHALTTRGFYLGGGTAVAIQVKVLGTEGAEEGPQTGPQAQWPTRRSPRPSATATRR